MKIQRSFFYIRPESNDVLFYHEANNSYVDTMRKHCKQIDSQLEFEFEIVSDQIHRFNLIHPNHELFKTVTQNLYFDGALKQEFKNCMKWTKANQIAFALSAHKIGMHIPVQYTQDHYYNIKTDAQTFIDATPAQKRALHLYDFLVGKPEMLFTINFFDYKHNVKHVENRLVGVDHQWWKNFFADSTKIYSRFFQDKKRYNQQNNIAHFVEVVDVINHQAGVYKPVPVVEFLPNSLKNIELSIC
jgi:hypothetical protein